MRFLHILTSERGATTTEYSFLGSGVALVAVLALSSASGSVNGALDSASCSMKGVGSMGGNADRGTDPVDGIPNVPNVQPGDRCSSKKKSGNNPNDSGPSAG